MNCTAFMHLCSLLCTGLVFYLPEKVMNALWVLCVLWAGRVMIVTICGVATTWQWKLSPLEKGTATGTVELSQKSSNESIWPNKHFGFWTCPGLCFVCNSISLGDLATLGYASAFSVKQRVSSPKTRGYQISNSILTFMTCSSKIHV